MKRILSVLLICVLLAGVLPMPASAEKVVETSDKFYGYVTANGTTWNTVTIDQEITVWIFYACTNANSYVYLVKHPQGIVEPTYTLKSYYDGAYEYGYDAKYVLSPGTYDINIAPSHYVFSGGNYWIQLRLEYESHTHSYSTRTVKPTCTSRGYVEHYCSCGDSYKTDYKDKLPHTEVSIPYTAPTCGTAGTASGGKKCSVCGTVTVKPEEIPATGKHKEETIPAVAPTCTQTGLTAGKKCSVCGTVTVVQETVPATGIHTEIVVEAVSPTCTETGLTEGMKCSVCGIFTVPQEVVPFVHEFQYHLCTLCGAPDSDDYLGYGSCGEYGDLVNWIVDAEGTLWIVGEGKMRDYYDYTNSTPWNTGDLRKQINKIIVGDDITEIGKYAFSSIGWGDDHDIEVYLPDGIKEIKERTFIFSHIKSIRLPSDLETIGDSAFGYCDHLLEIDIPSSVTTIGSSAFTSCHKLTSVVIPDGVTELNRAFSSCDALESVEIPDSVTSLYHAFSVCKNLKTIDIPDSVTQMSYTFSSSNGPEDLVLPARVEDITGICRWNSDLKSVVLRSSITNMNSAFYDCSNLETIYWPSGLSNVSSNAFGGCSSIKDVYYGGTEEQWNALDFDTKSRFDKATIHYESELAPQDPEILYGDVNGDGKVNAKDATAILKYVVGRLNETEINLLAADVNGDTKVNAKDATAILKFIVGKLEALPTA